MGSAREQVRNYILSAIEEGRFAAGSRLPAERVLCQSLSVSRSAVRSALGVLEGEGRIIRTAGSGSVVAGTGDDADLSRLVSPAQVMEARLALEPSLAPLIAANGSDADLQRLRECVDNGAKAQALQGFEIWDAAFHQGIADATHNPLVKGSYRFITRARDLAEWGELKRQSLTDERRAQYQKDHEQILRALVARDIRAAEHAIREHLLRVRNNLLSW